MKITIDMLNKHVILRNKQKVLVKYLHKAVGEYWMLSLYKSEDLTKYKCSYWGTGGEYRPGGEKSDFDILETA